MNKFLPRAEMFLLALFAAAIALELFEINLAVLFIISLSGLSLVFFLYAQFPSNTESSGEGNQGFKHVLGLTLVPKVLWISTAVTTVGILFYTQEFPGMKTMLTVGGISIAICTIILLFLRFMKINGLESVFPILYRSYPALLAAAYILLA
jgi:hypothetical protein